MGGCLNALPFICLTAIPLIYDEFQRNAPAALYLPYDSLYHHLLHYCTGNLAAKS